MSTVWVLNTGSSSLKFSVVDAHSQQTLLSGLAEKIGSDEASLRIDFKGGRHTSMLPEPTHHAAVQAVYGFMREHGLDAQLAGVGHRVVHGAESFRQSTLIDDKVMDVIERCVPFAPLHNPANITGIRVAQQVAPHLPQVAVFDTAFHQSLQPESYLYAVPMAWYREFGVRRYGFHGTSHAYVTQRAAEWLRMPLSETAFISAHLGNGASAAAVLGGKSVDTTMGFTPLEGLVMGTRSGDIDPGLLPYLAQRLGIDAAAVVDLLNKQSGLLGLSELSNDMRELTAAANEGLQGANIAIEVFVFRLARAIGALAASLPRIDALIFTGGIGENAAPVRAKVLQRLGIFGFRLDDAANRLAVGGRGGLITEEGSTRALVINTNEEAMIARETLAILQSRKND